MQLNLYRNHKIAHSQYYRTNGGFKPIFIVFVSFVRRQGNGIAHVLAKATHILLVAKFFFIKFPNVLLS